MHKAQETIEERDKMIANYTKENTALRKELKSYRRQGVVGGKSFSEAALMLETISKASGGMKN